MYCEENVWHLCVDPRVGTGTRAAIVISNAPRTVAVAHQRAAPIAQMPVVWDYHVVLAARGDGDMEAGQGDAPARAAWTIWDLDSTLGLGVALEDWLREAFALPAGFGADYAPVFRVLEADEYRRALVSDRSHMRDGHGAWLSPPPPWPAPGQGPPTLMRLVAMDEETGSGTVTDADGLRGVLAAL